MTAKTDFSKFNCSLAKALGSIGDWWTLLILRDAFMGSTRFGEFQQSLGIARNILSVRIEALVKAGVFARGGTQARPVYTLTEKGEALLPALLALMQWGDAWESDAPPMVITDEKGEAVRPIVALTRSGRELSAKSTRFSPGPGANKRTRDFMNARLARAKQK